MNDHISTDELFNYQTRRLKELIEEIVQCCQMHTDYFSGKFGVPQAELRCLLLFRDERYLTVKGLAKKLSVAKSRVTKLVAGLIHKNLVESIDDPSDGRVKLLRLTTFGQNKCEEMGRFIWGAHEKLLNEIESGQRKNLIASLEILREGMEAVKKDMT